jgi:MFS family permease
MVRYILSTYLAILIVDQANATPKVAMYIIARMILGAGILFCIISGAALIGELAHPKERAVMTSLFNSSYFIGGILASAIALGTTDIASNWAWRLPSLLQICPSLLQVCTVL